MVSVIVPSYNRAESLKRCLDSLVLQVYKNFEVLVCDDGSTDDTEQVVKSFQDTLLIRYFWSENFGGPARPRNIGIANALGCYLAFLDSDDWWEPKKLQKSVEALEAGADLVYHDLYIIQDGKDLVKSRRKMLTQKLSSPVFDNLLLNGNVINCSSVVVRRNLMEKIGGFSEDRQLIAAEDYDAWLRLARHTERFVRIKDCLGYYSWGGDNLSSNEKTETCVNRILNLYADEIHSIPRWIYYSLARVNFGKSQYLKGLLYFVNGIQKNPTLLFQKIVSITRRI